MLKRKFILAYSSGVDEFLHGTGYYSILRYTLYQPEGLNKWNDFTDTTPQACERSVLSTVLYGSFNKGSVDV